jgi:hypothetical protein
MMAPPKPALSRKPDFRCGPNDRHGRDDALRSQRLAHEEAQKAAGLWGEMSVGVIERLGTAFVHIWQGAALTDAHRLAMKRPKEISKPEHEVLCAWLKAGRFEGFKHSISAWSVNIGEAERIKLEIISRLAAGGTRIVNPVRMS